MERMTNRRGRRYDLTPLPELGSPKVGYAAAILDEARERCVDVISDMSEEAMWRKPPDTPFSAGDLVLHMNWAELVWLPKIADGGHNLPPETVAMIERGNLSRLYDPDSTRVPVDALVRLCRTTREHLVIPCLETARDIDQPVTSTLPAGKGPKTVREILMHVTASWIYHTGQVGLLTLQNGLDYQWAFA